VKLAAMKLIDKKSVLKTRPFEVEEVTFELDDLTPELPYFRLAAPDWINVLPVAADGRVILIRQPRVGSMSYVLETPGGVMDPHEKDPTMAAARELEEETGFVSQRFLPLGSMNPNPALMTNRCHFFVALGCLPASQRKHFPDKDERITLEFVQASELDFLVRTGQINHALACLCVMLAARYINLK
jgi:ADP-ribose pyrophosphatase